MRRGIGVVELDPNRLVRLGRNFAKGLLVLAQIWFRHVCGAEEHPFLDAGKLHLEQIFLAVEFLVSLRFLSPLVSSLLLEQEAIHLGIRLFHGILVPELPHWSGTQRRFDGIGQMPIIGKSDDLRQHLEGFLRADVATGDGGLHPNETVFILSGFCQKRVSVLGQAMPVTQLTGGCGPGVMVVASKYLTQQRQVGLLYVAIGPDGLDLVVAETFVLGIELSDPLVEGGLDLGWILFAQFALGPIAIAVLPALQDIQQFRDGCSRDLRRVLRLGPLGKDSPDAARLSVASFVPQGILGMTLYRIVPVANVHGATRSVA